MTEHSEAVVVDCLGEFCPIPLIRLSKAIDSAEVGTVIEVWSDDEGAKVDIPVWCRMKGQEFLGRTERDKGWTFLVRRV